MNIARRHIALCRLTHSLTAALDQLTVVASSTSNDPDPAIRAAPTDRPTSSSTRCSQFLRGRRPGGCFQSAAGGVPVWASIESCSACEAGVFSGRLARCRGLPRNTWSPCGERHAQYRNSQFSKLVYNIPIPVNPLEVVVMGITKVVRWT